MTDPYDELMPGWEELERPIGFAPLTSDAYDRDDHMAVSMHDDAIIDAIEEEYPHA